MLLSILNNYAQTLKPFAVFYFYYMSASQYERELKSILESYPEADSEDGKRKKQQVTVKRLLGTLKNLRTEIEHSSILSKKLAREIDHLIAKIESEL